MKNVSPPYGVTDSRSTHRGFHMTFANGHTVSVQFGFGTYSSNKKAGGIGDKDEVPYTAETAEVAAWDNNGNWLRLGKHDDVAGWVEPDRLAEIIADVASRERIEL